MKKIIFVLTVCLGAATILYGAEKENKEKSAQESESDSRWELRKKQKEKSADFETAINCADPKKAEELLQPYLETQETLDRALFDSIRFTGGETNTPTLRNIELLLHKKANPNSTHTECSCTYTPLKKVLAHQSYASPILKLLLTHKADTATQPDCAPYLLPAIVGVNSKDAIENIRLLLEHDAPIPTPDECQKSYSTANICDHINHLVVPLCIPAVYTVINDHREKRKKDAYATLNVVRERYLPQVITNIIIEYDALPPLLQLSAEQIKRDKFPVLLTAIERAQNQEDVAAIKELLKHGAIIPTSIEGHVIEGHLDWVTIGPDYTHLPYNYSDIYDFINYQASSIELIPALYEAINEHRKEKGLLEGLPPIRQAPPVEELLKADQVQDTVRLDELFAEQKILAEQETKNAAAAECSEKTA